MDRQFYRHLLLIALPIGLQSMISYSVNMMDTLMLGTLGETTLAAASIANQMFFVFSLLVSGLGCAAAVLCSQYYGKRDLHSVQKVAAMVIKIAFALGLMFMAVLVLFPSQVMGIFTPDGVIIQQGVGYLRVIAISYLCFAITTTLLIVLRSIQNVNLSLAVYTVSLIINVFVNYIFIFGKFGAPALGIVGAAIGTVVARSVEMIIVLFYVLKKEQVLKLRISMLAYFDRDLLKDMIKYGTPIMIGELFWGVGLSAHTAILGHMGEVVIAANSICNVLQQFALSFVQGLSNAGSVIMGEIIGKGQLKQAKKASIALVKSFALGGVIAAGFMMFISEPLFSIYSLEEETLVLARQFMIVYAIVTMFRAVAAATIGGILWGSGDTLFAAVVDVFFLWVLLPVGLVAAFRWNLHPVVVLLILRLETPIKAVICMVRLRGTSWIKSVTRESDCLEV